MMQQLKSLITKFESLKPRERLMVFFAGLVLIYSVINVLLLEPELTLRNQLHTEISQSTTQMTELQQQLTTFADHPVIDGNAFNKAKILELQLLTQEKAKKIHELSAGLIMPEAMPALLKGLLQQNADLSLVGMRTLAPRNVVEQQKTLTLNGAVLEVPVQASSLTKDQPTIYEHRLEVTFTGKYLDLLRYVESLESLKPQVLWRSAHLKAKDYPSSELTLTLYTLSLDKTWLSI